MLFVLSLLMKIENNLKHHLKLNYQNNDNNKIQWILSWQTNMILTRLENISFFTSKNIRIISFIQGIHTTEGHS